MAGLGPAIHDFASPNEIQDVDARDKPGHDDVLCGTDSRHAPIAATASISISQPGRASRVTVTSVDAGGFSTLT